ARRRAFEARARRFGMQVREADNEEMIARYNVAPSQPVPIVIVRDGQGRLLTAGWGLRPFWARNGGAAPPPGRGDGGPERHVQRRPQARPLPHPRGRLLRVAGGAGAEAQAALVPSAPRWGAFCLAGGL